GGTETSTERRIIFSPEIPGRRIGSAKPEWWAFREVMRRARPDRLRSVGMDDADAIRQEIARAIPLYKGIDTLRAKGDQMQWGGGNLYADGKFATDDGKAHFTAVSTGPDRRVGAASRLVSAQPDRRAASAADQVTFAVSTRRGKQFNSMLQ